MRTSKSSNKPHAPGLGGPVEEAGGPARYVLGMALLVPLAFVLMGLTELPGRSLASPAAVVQSDTSVAIMGKRPISSNPAPPPTLVPPTATPRPTVAPAGAAETLVAPSATPHKGGTYTVQPGDELKSIAAHYNVSIWKIIDVNKIPNPDSLKIGQELRIPTE